MLLFGIVMTSLGSLLPSIMVKFNLDEIAAGTLTSILPLGILLGSVIFGPIVDKYGYKSLLIVCSFLILIGLEGIAFTDSILVIQICIFLIGFGGGVLNGGTNALVADISDGEKSANLSLLGVFFGIGALGMPAVLGGLSESFAQESILAGVGLSVIFPLFFFTPVKFPSPKNPQGFPLKESFKLLKEPFILLFGLILFFESGVEGLVNNWTPTYLIDKFSLSTESALLSLTVFVIGLTLARIALGFLLKKFSSKSVFIGCLLFALAGSIICKFSDAIFYDRIGLFLMGIGLSAGFPVVLGYVGDKFAHVSGTAFSIVLFIALTGNMIINYLMGIIGQLSGISNMVLLLAGILLLMIILVTFSIKDNSKSNN